MPEIREITAGGRVVAPGAGVTVATIAASALPAGVYDISVHCDVGTGFLAVDEGNMQLLAGAVSLANPIPQGIGGADDTEPFVIHGVKLDGATALTVKAVAASTASVPYTATIEAQITEVDPVLAPKTNNPY